MHFKPKPENAYIKMTNLWVGDASIRKNLQWLFLEALFSKQIISIMSNTASVADEKAFQALGHISGGGSPTIGLEAGLEEFLPANFLGKKLERQLVEMLEMKYVRRYGFIYPSKIEVGPAEGGPSYRMNKNIAQHFTVYLGQLDFAYFCLEAIATIGAWTISNHGLATVAVIAAFEFVRRFKP